MSPSHSKQVSLLLHFIIVSTLGNTHPLSAVAQNVDCEENQNRVEVSIERNFRCAPYPEPGQVGDVGSLIVDVHVAGDWMIATVESGVLVFPNTPFSSGLSPSKQRRSRIVGVNVVSGETTSIVIKGNAAQVQFSAPNYVDDETIAFELCDRHRCCLGKYYWRLASDRLVQFKHPKKCTSATQATFNPAGLLLELKKTQSVFVTDGLTKQSTTIPVHSQPTESRPKISSGYVGSSLTIVGPGSQSGRVLVYDSRHTSGLPSIRAYDPSEGNRVIWKTTASLLETTCSRTKCNAILPAQKMQYPCNQVPVIALFEKQAPSLAVLKGGAVEWFCDVPAIQEWDYIVASEDERFVAISGGSDRFSAVVVDTRKRTVSRRMEGDEYINCSVEGITNDGRLVLSDGDAVLVCTNQYSWQSKKFNILEK